MLQQFVEFCTSDGGLMWIGIASDFAIAAAYFAIPITMAIVLRHRKDDIPYPWLWTLFVAFIVACALTHTAHLWSAVTGRQYLWLHATVGAIAALASVGTAVAFTFILPEIKLMPSAHQQRLALEKIVAARSQEKDQLIREINHRIGNQLQVITSAVSIESRKATGEEAKKILDRLREELARMKQQHDELSRRDYLTVSEINS